ncbi:hypothetical protein [Kordia sp.]|uniref:hypothetical protein n=1 Tax=Kordia sp. TaxID=1965332 RepID=UPI003B5A8A06
MDERLIEKLNIKLSGEFQEYEKNEQFAEYLGNIFRDTYMEITGEYYTSFKIPDSYAQLLKSFPHGFLIDIDHSYSFFGTLGCIESTISDISLWSTLNDERKKIEPWIFIGIRGDKGNIYLCCDSSSDYFGRVEEFYDGSAFMENAIYENMQLETLEELCTNILNQEKPKWKK